MTSKNYRHQSPAAREITSQAPLVGQSSLILRRPVVLTEGEREANSLTSQDNWSILRPTNGMLTHVKVIRPPQTHTRKAEREHGGCGLFWKFGSSESRVPLSTCSPCSWCATASLIKVPHYRMERFYFKIYVFFFCTLVCVRSMHVVCAHVCLRVGIKGGRRRCPAPPGCTLELTSLVSWADPAPVTLHPLPPQPRVLSTRSHAHLFTGWLMQTLSPTEPSPQSFV